MRKIIPWLVATLVLGGTFVYLRNLHSESVASEPDNYFHLAMARMTAENGVVRAIPQADNLVWKEKFTGNYFLFTLLTAIGWRLGGETGTLALVPLLGTILLLLLFGFTRRYVPWGTALALPFFILTNAAVTSRLWPLRPSLLAECLLVGLAFGIVRSSPVWVGTACFLFPLAYHALYLPAFLLGVALVLGIYFRNGWPRLAGVGAIALAVGMLLNPYFPENLSAISDVFQFLLAGRALSPLETPLESVGWTFREWLARTPLFALFLGLGVWQLAMERRPRRGKKLQGLAWEPEFLFLFAVCATFSLLVLLSYRAMEYAGPFGIVFAAVCLQRFTRTEKQKFALVAAGIALSLPELFYFFSAPMPSFAVPSEMQAAIKAIPRDAGKKVFNCDWFLGGPLLYWRPDLKFVDLGDPNAMDSKTPGYSEMKSNIRLGRVPYLLGPIRYAFHSDYVACRLGQFAVDMDASPDFRRLHPSLKDYPGRFPVEIFSVHEVRSSPHPAFVFDLEVQIPDMKWRKDAREVTSDWVPWTSTVGLRPEQRSPFLDLSGWAAKTLDKTEPKGLCVDIRPTAQEIRKHGGAVFLGVGGAPNVRVLFNHQVLWTRREYPLTRALDQLVPLPHALGSHDRLVVRVCRQQRIPMGVALSFWSRLDLEETCRWKGMPLLWPKDKALFYTKPMETCLAPIAVKTASF